MSNKEEPLRAVFFDIGGVVILSPLIGIANYEKQKGMPKDWINTLITRRGSNGAWQRFERGELKLLEFYQHFGRELSDVESGKKWYQEYCDKRNLPFPTLPDAESMKVDGRELFAKMMRGSKYDEVVVEAINRIRATGKWKLVAVTNNYARHAEDIPQDELAYIGWDKGVVPEDLHRMFDDFVDSSVVGVRKPEPEMFLLACKRNNMKPTEVVMIDDLGMNLKSARDLGMRTILVPIGGSVQAMRELEKLLGIELVDERLVEKDLKPKL